MVDRDIVAVYKDAAGEWRWNRKSSNGRILADSGEGYINRDDAVAMAIRVNKAAEVYVDSIRLLNV